VPRRAILRPGYFIWMARSTIAEVTRITNKNRWLKFAKKPFPFNKNQQIRANIGTEIVPERALCSTRQTKIRNQTL
jgi:hypothetical protein